MKKIFIILIVLLLTSCQTSSNAEGTSNSTNIDNIEDVTGLICAAKEPLKMLKLEDPDSTVYGYINEDDRFEVYESKEIDGTKWYRIAPTLWVINNNNIELSDNKESIANKNIDFFNIKQFPKSIIEVPFDNNGDIKDKTFSTNVDCDENGQLQGLYIQDIDGGSSYYDLFYPYGLDLIAYGPTIEHNIASDGVIAIETAYGEGHYLMWVKQFDHDVNNKVLRISYYFDYNDKPIETQYCLYNEDDQLSLIKSYLEDGDFQNGSPNGNKIIHYNGNYAFCYLYMTAGIDSLDLNDYFLGYVYRFDNDGKLLEYYDVTGFGEESTYNHYYYNY